MTDTDPQPHPIDPTPDHQPAQPVESWTPTNPSPQSTPPKTIEPVTPEPTAPMQQGLATGSEPESPSWPSTATGTSTPSSGSPSSPTGPWAPASTPVTANPQPYAQPALPSGTPVQSATAQPEYGRQPAGEPYGTPQPTAQQSSPMPADPRFRPSMPQPQSASQPYVAPDYGPSWQTQGYTGTPQPPAGMTSMPAPMNGYAQYGPQAYQGAPAYAYDTPRVPDRLPWPGCPFGDAIRRYWTGYVRFDGRASRSEFWFAMLFLFLVGLVVSWIPFINVIWGLATFLPSLAIAVRRLHDAGKPGWWLALLYAGGFVSGILMGVGLAGLIASTASYGYAYEHDGQPVMNPATPLTAGMLIVGLLGAITVTVVWILLMTRPSDPTGTRFDR
ncbi:hypothetical protein CSQ85_09080 [Bifidobacterium rousetti]|uniref:DUF805 domain-containing protein n=1 Tax=Bifidobacterium rousetti TaxID=2045439 RepID=UPI00123C42B2|nr:DUF805 domain-containing protein [Bifidobacterium rousetti]KAA8818304.1 hypothetical protein CSQ85_09080 [Bifidobacterium rousetti]